MSKANIATTEYGTAVSVRIDDNDITTKEFWGEGSADAALGYYKALTPEEKGNWHQFQPVDRPLVSN